MYSRNRTNQLQPTNVVDAENLLKPASNKVMITVDSKNITLPNNEATLNAHVSKSNLKNLNIRPKELSYSWKQVMTNRTAKSNNSIIIKNADSKTLSVSNLSKGKYKFQVSVTGPKNIESKSFGEINVLSGIWIINSWFILK